MKVNICLKRASCIIIGCLWLMIGFNVFAETKPQITQPEAPQTALTKADLDEIHRIVDESISNKTRPLIREIAKMGQGEEAGFKEIVGGIGYIFGIIGVIMFFLSRKEVK